MAEPTNCQTGRFRSAAPHYLAGRPAYAPRLIGLVARLTDLAADDRLDSAFSLLDEISVIERRPVSVMQLIHRAFSRSSTTPDRLGSAASRLSAEIEGLLQPVATDGMLTEVVATGALLARRPGA